MIDAPEIVETTPKPLAIIAIQTPLDGMRAAIGAGLQELFPTLAAQGITPIGPWFTHHLKCPDQDGFDFEMCIETATPVCPSGRIKPGTWPAMRVARTIHHGAYEGLQEAWGEFHAWLDANEVKTAEDLWEVYLVNPDNAGDPADYRTQLNREIPI